MSSFPVLMVDMINRSLFLCKSSWIVLIDTDIPNQKEYKYHYVQSHIHPYL